jgi:hypothetical protein
MINWLRYSGLSATITLNPLHWQYKPFIHKEANVWAGPKEHTWSLGFLFLTFRVWIDNGDW